MARLLQLLVPAGILAAGVFLSATGGSAKPDYARRTNKECRYCHPSDSWKLNDAGKYYRDHKYSLEGYKPPAKSSK